MPFNPIAGPSGSVIIGATSYSFNKWKCSMKVAIVKVTNFNSGGYQQIVTAVIMATITVEGPYDGGNMPFVVGNQYVWNLNFNNVLGLSVPAVIESIDASQDEEDAGRVSIQAQSNGTFSARIA